jgi:hypothetical protein
VKRFTRRGLFGAGAVAAVATGVYGRFAVGDEFEEHVAGVLGVTLAQAKDLAANARAGLGDPKYDLVASSFLFATTEPGRSVAPRGARRRAVHVFLSEAVPSPQAHLMLLGLASGRVENSTCTGLVRG